MREKTMHTKYKLQKKTRMEHSLYSRDEKKGDIAIDKERAIDAKGLQL